jgi:hypothetical protein
MPIGPLTFLGDHNAPDPLSSVHARRPILGTGKRPDRLAHLAEWRSLFVEGAGEKKPSVHVERVAQGDVGLWRIDIPVGKGPHGARPGLTRRREKPETVLKQVEQAVPFSGFRPDWADALFVPRRAAPEGPRTLGRFNGRRVTPLWVFGNDDRWAFRDPSWPWGLVGRIFNNRGQSGTGALFGDRLVVTASHLVPWEGEEWWIQFVPAYYDGVSLYGAGVQSDVSDAIGYDNAGNVSGYDWAVLRLFEPLGSWLGYFGVNGYSEAWNDQPYWSIIGYPSDVAGGMRPSFQGGITVGDVDSDSHGGAELESDTADLTDGNSGGPMFGWWGDDPRIVGVVSGGEEYSFLGATFDRDNIMAAGTGFTGLCIWGRSNWPA